MMKFIALITAAIFLVAPLPLRAQAAAQPTVDLGAQKNATNEPEKLPTPPPEVPELSQLDEAFKEKSLGTEADETRTRIEWRKLQNEVASEPAVIAAKKAADSARTDLEKRDRLRDYYNLCYGRMRARATTAELKKALDEFKKDHLALLAQPRVRPTGDAPVPTPTPNKKKHQKSRFGVGH